MRGGPRTKIERLEQDVSRTVAIRSLQPIVNIALRRKCEPLDGDRRPAHVTREPLKLCALVGLDADAGVQ
jgi:hypothetical protein